MSAITGDLIEKFATSVSPIFIVFTIGLVYTLRNVLKPDHGPALSTFIHYVGLPALVFRRLSLQDARALDLKLLGADALSKFIPLLLLLLWWRFCSKLDKIHSLEWVVTLFMLSTLPNTVLIGDSILTPMFGQSVKSDTTAIIFAQSLYWYNCVIFLMEIRELMLEDDRKKFSLTVVRVNDTKKANQRIQAFHVAPSGSSDENQAGEGWIVSRSLSAPPALAHSTLLASYLQMGTEVDQRFMADYVAEETQKQGGEEGQPSPAAARDVVDPPSSRLDGSDIVSNYEKAVDNCCVSKEETQEVPEACPACFTKATLAGVAVLRVVKRMLQTPLLYGSALGFIWSLLAFRYHWKLPTFLLTTLDLCAGGTIGAAMLLLGMTLAKNILASKGLVPCGYKLLFAGFFARFLVAPIIMYISALAFSIKGNLLRYAIVQVIVPQGSMTFALARHYDCKVSIMSTTIYVQMVVFIPIILGYYAAIEAI